MDKSECKEILKHLKERYERMWEIMELNPEQQQLRHAELNPEGEKVWRRKYIEALDTAIREL